MSQAISTVLLNDGVIAYPTETVYGIGCLPTSQYALQRINCIKQRTADKGFIIVANKLSYLQHYCDYDLSQLKQPSRATTYLVPCKKEFIGLLTGNKNTIAVRLSNHHEIAQVCNSINNALVSTSLNISGKPAINTQQQAVKQFNHLVDVVIHGECGKQAPSQIIDVQSKKVLRI